MILTYRGMRMQQIGMRLWQNRAVKEETGLEHGVFRKILERGLSYRSAQRFASRI